MGKKKILTTVIIIAILLMGVGYAALSNIDLTITGTAKATPNPNNFKVYFTGATPTTNAPAGATVTVEPITNGATTATVNMEGLTTKGETASAILEIENGSDGINASSVNVTAQNTDTEYFDIAATMCDATGTPIADSNYAVAAGAKTYVKVSATLLKNPTTDVQTNIAVTVTAEPEV